MSGLGLEFGGAPVAPPRAAGKCADCGTEKRGAVYPRRWPGGMFATNIAGEERQLCKDCFARIGRPPRVLAWTGTYPDMYSPTRKPKRYDCLIRDANGGYRRYMIGRNDGGGSRGWVVVWNDKGDDSGEFLLPEDYGASACYLDGSDRKCAWVSFTHAKEGCESHYQNWQMAAPISLVSLDALGRPTDDEKALAIMVESCRKSRDEVGRGGCDAPFCWGGQVYTAFEGYVVCPHCGGKEQDDSTKKEAKQ